jgi:hypothetical protein
MTATATVPARHTRQEALAPYDKLRATHAVLVGVGAVGRQVALQLAAMGVGRLDLFDHDLVEEVNLGPQAYRPGQLMQNKCHATGVDVVLLNPEVKVVPFGDKFTRGHRGDVPAGAAVFSCVDSILTRRLIWESVKDRCGWFGDARVAGDTIRVLASRDPAADAYYPTTFFNEDEAFRGACTAKMTVYAANVAAGVLVHQFCRWLRGTYCIKDQTLNLLAGELTTED